MHWPRPGLPYAGRIEVLEEVAAELTGGGPGGGGVMRYEIVDMFAERPFTGSALAVVPEAVT